jgi:O-antigen/teichoic acid export membrane protein
VKNNLLRIVFSSGLQAVAAQLLGMVFFYVVAGYMSKDDFGVISWANAAAVMLTTLLSFGMDQVVVRRIATSRTSEWAAAAYLVHAFFGSLIMFLLLMLYRSLAPVGSDKIAYLPWFFAAQALIFTGAPLKHFLNAKQRFGPYGVIATISNALKISIAAYLITRNDLSLATVVAIMIFCGLFELAALFVFVLRKSNFSLKFKSKAYTGLLKESLPQYISVIFDSSLSRMDWFLLGILASSAATADYSIASRAFEISRLPLSVIAPILLARFAPMLSMGGRLNDDKQQLIKDLFRLEMFAIFLIPLVANILWTPVVEYFFKGKYGAVNANQFMLLSICLPMQFFINLLWTLSFSAKKYKQVTTITIYSAIINVVLSIIMIKVFHLGGLGTAISFLTTTFLQMLGYYMLVRKTLMTLPVRHFFGFLALAAGCYYIAVTVTQSIYLQLPIAVGLYVISSLMLKLVSRRQIEVAKKFIRK